MKLKISKPVTPWVILQGFGVNGGYYQKNGINIKGHNGLDLKTFHGQPVYAAHDGTALYQVDRMQGHGVVVITKESYEYEDRLTPFKTIYWHFCDPIKEPKFKSPIADKGGVDVKEGDLIGYADSTGFSSGTHLHFAVKPLSKTGENLYTWGPAEPDNGYNGCIDPTPYIEEKSPVDIAEAIVNNIFTSDITVPEKLSLLEQIKKILSMWGQFYK